MVTLSDEEFRELQAQIHSQKSLNNDLQDTINTLRQTVQSLSESAAKSAATIAELNATIAQLQETIRQLNERLNKDSHNSSKPPSSDGYRKPNPHSLRKKTNKKQGAQPGHEGKAMKAYTEPDRIVPHVPSQCVGCPRLQTCMEERAKVRESRTTVDIKIVRDVVRHDAIDMPCCPCHGGSDFQGVFPAKLKAYQQYGENLQAFVVTLSTIGAVSESRIQEILSGAFAIPLAIGTIQNFIRRCADGLELIVTGQIRKEVLESAAAHADETGCRVNKHLGWIHTFCNEDAVFLGFSFKRGKKGIVEVGVIPDFKGILVHDFWGAYWKISGVEAHAVCCAHLLRELKGLYENDPEHQKWANLFGKLLIKALASVRRAKAAGKDHLSESTIKRYEAIYDSTLRWAHSLNPMPEQPAEKKKGRPRKGKALCLIERLENHKAEVCRFLTDFRVPFSNNLAERSFRHVKNKAKVSGCFRTETGIKDYCTIMSFVGTAKKHGKNGFTSLLNAISGNPAYIYA